MSGSNLRWIEELARQERLTSPTASNRDLVRALKVWWCTKYNRPFKDPLLLSYTLEELFYEYMTHHFINPDNDPVKQKLSKELEQDDEEWVKTQLKQMGQISNTPPDPPVMGENIGELPPEFTTNFEE